MRLKHDTLQRDATPDRKWLWLCALSLLFYLLLSEAVTAFLREVSRLIGKL